MAPSSQDVLFGWLMTAPDGTPAPSQGEVCEASKRKEVCKKARKAGAKGEKPLFVDLGGTPWGLVTLVRCDSGKRLLRGFLELEEAKEGADFVSFDPAAEGEKGEQVVLLKQDLFSAFLCRAWARNGALEGVRSLLNEGNACPFDESGQVILGSDDEIAGHYLDLLLGRGACAKCPKAQQILEGPARDMTLDQQPYICAVLEARSSFKGGDSVLDVLTQLGQGKNAGGDIPADIQEDLALVVAAKSLQLVQDLGLDFFE